MKMEGIELYPHNQKAYDNLCAMLRDNNRACVVQPTGTGKFVIIAKMAQDNPGKNFLLLGTNDYMYIDQMANLSDIAPGFTPKNLQFMTYATAMAKARCGDEIPRCDVIVADEFHHCGAPEWGKGVQYVVENNPDAKIVGFSATPIRYSDKGRNMADEMFVGNIASSMELEEAWLDGVLPMPKYVIALYDAPKELGELKVSIEKVREKKKYSKFVKNSSCQIKGRQERNRLVLPYRLRVGQDSRFYERESGHAGYLPRDRETIRDTNTSGNRAWNQQW